MPFTAHRGAFFNVAGSFNDFFETQITAKGLPSWMTSAVVNFDMPQQPLTFPSFSVAHLGTETREMAQGRALDDGWRGAEQIGLAGGSCWESYPRASPPAARPSLSWTYTAHPPARPRTVRSPAPTPRARRRSRPTQTRM